MTDKQVLLDNPDLFLAHYFADKLYELQDFHLRLITTATTIEKALILYPAGHGKTTLVSTLLPIWALCRDPNIRIAVIGKNEDEAKSKIGRSIIAELMGNDDLIRDFGPFKPSDDSKPWSITGMTVERRTLRAKEPTIAFFGSGSKGTLGHRANWTICDDVVTETNSATPEQRGKMREWFNQSVTTIGLPGARTTVVGTLFDPEDLYNDLIELNDPETGAPIWYVQHEDAIVETCECKHAKRDHAMGERSCRRCKCKEFVTDTDARVPLWPDFWPWPKLMQQKASMGTLDFNKRYRNIAVDKSRMVFREEYVKGGYIGSNKYDGCLDEEFVVGDYDQSWRRVAGFDPAIGAYRSAKFCSHTVLAMGSCAKHERCAWVIDLHRDQMALPLQVELILNEHKKYDLFSSVIEANAYQQGLLDAVIQRMKESGDAYRIEPHYTSRQNKPDPQLGVEGMGPWFENGMVHIPWGNAESRRKMQPFIDELVMYPARTTDTVMSFWFAWRTLLGSAPKYRSFNSLREGQKKTAWGRRVRGRRIRNPAYPVLESEEQMSPFMDVRR